MSNRSHASIRQAWVDRMDRFKEAGQTAAQFCDAERVSQASFYKWRRRLASNRIAVPSTVPKFVPVNLPPSPPTEHGTTKHETVMSVELPGGVRVRLEVTSGKGSLS